jgi:hypothetical protein
MGARATRNWLTTQKQFRLRAAQHFTRVTRPTPSQVASAHCSPTAGKAQKPAESAGLAAVARHAATLGPRPNCSRSGTGHREKHAQSCGSDSIQRPAVPGGEWGLESWRCTRLICRLQQLICGPRTTNWMVRTCIVHVFPVSLRQADERVGPYDILNFYRITSYYLCLKRWNKVCVPVKMFHVWSSFY